MDIYKNRRLVAKLAKNDFKTRYAGSYLGIVWAFIQPVITILVYWFVFSVGFRSGTGDLGVPFVLYLVAGIVPWFFFSESVNSITNCLQEYNYLVKKVVFKVEILPIIKLISCLLVHAFFVVIMFGMYLIIGRMPSVIWFQLVYYSLAASLLALGIGFFTSAVNVFFKDMAQIVSICLQFGIWMTPIMYHESMFTGCRKMGGSAVQLNPFYYCGGRVAGIPMLTGNWFWERPTLTLYLLGALPRWCFCWDLRCSSVSVPIFSDVRRITRSVT